MKKLHLVYIVLSMVLLCFQPCYANEQTQSYETEIEERLIEALKNYEESVDLSDLNIQFEMYADEMNPELIKIMQMTTAVVEEHGSFTLGSYKVPYCQISFDTQPSEGNDNEYEIGPNDLKGVTILYETSFLDSNQKLDAELIQNIGDKVSTKYANIVDSIDRNLSDVEIALLLYDYIMVTSNYPDSIGFDDRGFEEYENKYYSEVNVFYEGMSVCAANARAYAMLLSEFGIDAVMLSSEPMNHAWVMLEIEGHWYHADMTWDDIRFTEGYTSLGHYNQDPWDIGAVNHEYFLKSDEEFLELNHYDWYLFEDFTGKGLEETPIADQSNAWDDYFFSLHTDGGNRSKFNYIDGTWYYINMYDRQIIAYKDGEYTYPDFGRDIQYMYSDGQKLFISTDSQIYEVEPSTSKKTIVLEAKTYGDNALISEMRVVDGRLDAVILVPSEDGYQTVEYSELIVNLDNMINEKNNTFIVPIVFGGIVVLGGVVFLVSKKKEGE